MAGLKFYRHSLGEGTSWAQTICACCRLTDEYCACKKMRSGKHKGMVPGCSTCYKCPTHHAPPQERCPS